MITLREIGKKVKISGRRLEDYINFFKISFPNDMIKGEEIQPFAESYATEWAERFLNRTEWDRSDLERRKVLLKVNEEKYKIWEKR